MLEYTTRALVLDKEPSREQDLEIHLLTEDLGRLTARAIGARRILSKLSAHLEPNSIAVVRLVEKRGLTVVDALLEGKVKLGWRERLFLKHGMVTGERDEWLWQKILNEESVNGSWLLSHFGFNPELAVCGLCGQTAPELFNLREQEFRCEQCFARFGGGEETVAVREG